MQSTIFNHQTLDLDHYNDHYKDFMTLVYFLKYMMNEERF